MSGVTKSERIITMKKTFYLLLTAAILSSLGLGSCTKSSSPTIITPTPTAPDLNQMEKLMVGKWYYTEIRDTNYNMANNNTYEKTDFTNQQDIWYLEFKSDFQYTVANTNHHAKTVNGFMDAGDGTPKPTSVWYYDETINKLNFFGGSSSPFLYDISINGKDMSMRLLYSNIALACKLRKQ